MYDVLTIQFVMPNYILHVERQWILPNVRMPCGNNSKNVYSFSWCKPHKHPQIDIWEHAAASIVPTYVMYCDISLRKTMSATTFWKCTYVM